MFGVASGTDIKSLVGCSIWAAFSLSSSLAVIGARDTPFSFASVFLPFYHLNIGLGFPSLTDADLEAICLIDFYYFFNTAHPIRTM